jgi:ubiquinone/menaquinone biosynthesis C-methylase UbiE
VRTSNSVRNIFNHKAQSWGEKYAPGGPLAKRLQYFHESLNKITPPPAKILDFGCGTGNLALYLSQSGYRITAIDIAEEMLRLAVETDYSARVEWRLLSPNWEILPFKDEVFDAIIASSTFEYLESVELALAQCSRVLKPNGTLAVTVPNLQCPTRVKEQRLRKLIDFRLSRYLELIPKVGQYLSYLKLSQNRLSRDEWSDLSKPFGLLLCDELSMEVQSASGEATLLLLTFKKLAPAQCNIAA